MSNLSKKDYKKFNKEANRREEHQEINGLELVVRPSIKSPWQGWQGMSAKSLLNILKDYKITSIEQNYNWDEEELVVRFCKTTSMPHVNLEHWF